MLNRTLGRYWKLCWGFIVPGTLSFLFVYFIGTFEGPMYEDRPYPDSAIIFGSLLVLISLSQVPIGAIYSLYKSEDTTLKSKLCALTKPTKNWGPISDEVRKDWLENCKITNPLEEEQLIVNNPSSSD